MAADRSADEIEDEIKASSAALADAVEELVHRGSPKTLMASAKQSLREKAQTPQGKAVIGVEHIVFDRPARLVERGPEPSAMPLPDRVEPGAKLSKVIQLSEARAIMDTLDACGGRRTEAARQLGISERTLRYRLASFREAGLAMGGRR